MGSTRVSSNLTGVVKFFLRDKLCIKKIFYMHYMHPVGFEPTPPERIELESTALDHSATDAYILCTHLKNIAQANSEIRTRDPLFTKQMH